MRAFVWTLLISASVLPLFGQAGPVVSPSAVTIQVGERVLLHGYQHPGGLSEGYPYHYEFQSDAPAVATVNGFASGSSLVRPDPIPGNGDITVDGVQPGLAHVRAIGLSLAAITVVPQTRPVEIHAETTRVQRGGQVVLLAVVPDLNQPATFFWYRGPMGDVSRLIQGSTRQDLTFVARDPGASTIWVQAFIGSRTSSAEITVEVVQPRGRPVRMSRSTP